MSDAAMVPLAEQQMTMKTLKYISRTPAIPARYEGRVDDMLAAVMYGNELGIGPMMAINELYLVDGKVSMSGKLMSLLVHRAGHELHVSFTNTATKVKAFRRDPYTHELHEAGEFTFSEADAKKAGLHTKSTYQNYPVMMRTWRAITFACRAVFADALGGFGHIPEEVGIVYDNNGEVEPLPETIDYIEDVDVELETASAEIASVVEVIEMKDTHRE